MSTITTLLIIFVIFCIAIVGPFVMVIILIRRGTKKSK